MLDMFKGISDNLAQLSSTEQYNQMPSNDPVRQRPNSNFNKQQSLPVTSPYIGNYKQDPQKSPPSARSNQIDKQIFNEEMQQTSNFPIKIALLLIDEVFDLKEKNQWLRQSMMSIVKSYVKNFKGDSMNRKIKEQIADKLGEQHIARYLKNFRLEILFMLFFGTSILIVDYFSKRLWPRGHLVENPPERAKSDKELTKVLVRTKLIPLVSGRINYFVSSTFHRTIIFKKFSILR